MTKRRRKKSHRHFHFGKRAQKAGLPPGTMVHIGEKKEEKARITCLDYDERSYREREAASIDECLAFRDTATVTWINVDGIHDLEVIGKVGEAFDVHPLVLEDIVNAGQRPKFEDFEKLGFVVIKMLGYDESSQNVEAEQVSIVFGRNFVISFQERVGDLFDSVRDRIRTGKGRIRKTGADYLAYCLIDAIVDGYFEILEKTGDRIEAMEDELVAEPREGVLPQIHALKHEMIALRRSVWPIRELIGAMQRSESVLITKETGVYLRDVYDHTIQIIDMIEGYRDSVAGMLDVYLSSISNRTNEVMKVLTMIATVFIPLSFITGYFGMNFRYMRELDWKWGQPVVMLLMSAVVVTMVLYFRRRRWL